MMGKYFFGAVLLACALTAGANAETLTNKDVVTLLQAGLGEEAVVAKIETSDADFVTDTATLISLRKQKVPSAVIAAMLKRSGNGAPLSDSSPDPRARHYSGVYLLDDWSKARRMWKIDPISSTQTKTGGIFGYALTAGIASASVKAVIPGATARFSSPDVRPVFYVFFDQANGQQTTAFSTGFGGAIQSPNEFSLVRLVQKEGRREARIGSLNIAGSKAGVMDKDRIPFAYEQISPGVYKVQPNNDLEKGEYGFIFAVGGGVGPGLAGSAGTAGARVFAFSVR